jgi:N-acetylglucosaminyldiphosphoundecaprenol N-acetyl-beta-D-mannosaminyltransferase
MGTKADILGVNVNAIKMREAVKRIQEWIEKKQSRYVCVTSVNGVMEAQSDKEFRDIVNSAGMVTPDGMPLVWLSRLKGCRGAERVYGPDLMLEVCRVTQEKGYSSFFYGGADGIPQKLKDSLCRKFPRLKVVGTYSPPFRPLTIQEDHDVVRMINGLSPDIIWLGISTPKQEKWMASHLGRLNARVLIGVGAAFDFLSGAKRQAPRWMQRSGLEWLFRLIAEPRRLWRRYLIGNTTFVWLILKEYISEKMGAKNGKQKNPCNRRRRLYRLSSGKKAF